MKLQQKCSHLERENSLLAAQTGGVRAQDSFVGRLVATVAGLYNRPLYSDLTILTPASSLHAHKFVLRLFASKKLMSYGFFCLVKEKNGPL